MINISCSHTSLKIEKFDECTHAVIDIYLNENNHHQQWSIFTKICENSQY